MVGRILGLLPCLAGIPAALELQSHKSGKGAAAEFCLVHCMAVQGLPVAGSSVTPQHLSRLSN